MSYYLTTAYISPQSVAQFQDIANWRLADGSPAIRFACIFAANYAADTLPFLRANNNQPPTDQQFNPNIQAVLDSTAISFLQSQGIKVLLTITNGWASVGWSEFTNQADAQDFVDYLAGIVTQYGLDGIDIDDEYSTGTPQSDSLAMVTTLMRQTMPDKLITKALWSDIQFFGVDWNGHTLEGNLDFGWQMSYGSAASNTLPPYVSAGMAATNVSKGYWSSQQPPSISKDVNWVKDNGYGGVMIFGFENDANVTLMGQLVNDLYGPGNWNWVPQS